MMLVENGRSEPGYLDLVNLAQVFNIKAFQLFDDESGFSNPHRKPQTGEQSASISYAPRIMESRWRRAPFGRLITHDVAIGACYRLHEETISDLEAVAYRYRSSYGHAPARELIPRAAGLLEVLNDVTRSHQQSPSQRARLTRITGQMSILCGLLSLMSLNDVRGARELYELALQAGREGTDTDLILYAQGSICFLAASAGEPGRALEYVSCAEHATTGASPLTRAWFAALASELHARAGDQSASERYFEQAEAMLDRCGEDPFWCGPGWFDRAKLTAYHGGNLVLLGRARAAEQELNRALTDLDPDRLKHRCTALADLATALVNQCEVDEACRHAHAALALATQIQHTESMRRIGNVYRLLTPWKDRGSVRELGERLLVGVL